MRYLLTSLDIEDLRGSIATGGDITAVAAEADAADHTRVSQVVDKLDVEHPGYSRIEDGVPIISFTLEIGREVVEHEISQLVADVWNPGARYLLRSLLLMRRRRGRMGDCRSVSVDTGIAIEGHGWRRC